MGVYIKGMEMPTSCYLCPCNKDDGFGFFTCGVTHCDCDFMVRPATCPLVHVPPHGDLIDRDEQIERAWRLKLSTRELIEEMLKSALTIIPAEDAKTEEDTDPWLCLSCRNYPPSSTDGKPCSQCNPSEVWHSCYDPAEEGE